MPTSRRSLLAGLALLGAGPVAAQGIDVGPPLGVVTLRIAPKDDPGFLHDLVDFTNRYNFSVIGRPGGPRQDGRAVFLAWYRRPDGITLLVSDLAAPERMEAYFYGRKDGTAGDVAAELMGDYVAKMASYPAFSSSGSTSTR